MHGVCAALCVCCAAAVHDRGGGFVSILRETKRVLLRALTRLLLLWRAVGLRIKIPGRATVVYTYCAEINILQYLIVVADITPVNYRNWCCFFIRLTLNNTES